MTVAEQSGSGQRVDKVSPSARVDHLNNLLKFNVPRLWRKTVHTIIMNTILNTLTHILTLTHTQDGQEKSTLDLERVKTPRIAE